MKYVEVVDGQGRKMRYALNDDDDPKDAAEIGINVGVPDLDRIDWEATVTKLHNLLYDRKLFTIDDIAREENALSGVIFSTFKQEIVALYKE